jgi:hypothetical protein
MNDVPIPVGSLQAQCRSCPPFCSFLTVLRHRARVNVEVGESKIASDRNVQIARFANDRTCPGIESRVQFSGTDCVSERRRKIE